MLAIVISFMISISALAAPDKEHKTSFFPPKLANKAMATRPETPKLLEPAFMAHITGGSVSLKWEASEGAKAYSFQLATDPNFKWLVANEVMFIGTSFEAKGLEAGKHYYWRVAAIKPDNEPTYTKSGFAQSMFDAQ